LAMLHAQPVQQRDQPRPALIGDTALGLDPGTNFAGCPRQRLGDPALQLGLLRIAQAARTAIIVETHQAFDALVLIQPMPGAHGVVVQQQDLATSSQLMPSSNSTSALARRAAG